MLEEEKKKDEKQFDDKKLAKNEDYSNYDNLNESEIDTPIEGVDEAD